MKGFLLGISFVGAIVLLTFLSLAGHWFNVGVKAADAPEEVSAKK